jgi:hypothetical protein
MRSFFTTIAAINARTLFSDLSRHTEEDLSKHHQIKKPRPVNNNIHQPPVVLTTKMPRRRSSAPPIHMQIAQIDHSMYPPRPIPDDLMSITTNQLDEERDHNREPTEDIIVVAEEEANRPEDFSPRLWQLFNRIQRRGTEPLFPADWQVPPLFPLLVPDAFYL